MRKELVLKILVVAAILWFLMTDAHAAPAARSASVELGEGTVTASDAETQLGSSDYYTSSAGAKFQSDEVTP
jgi:hypothetical protein